MLTIYITKGSKENFVNDLAHFYMNRSFIDRLVFDKKIILIGDSSFLDNFNNDFLFKFYINDFNDFVSNSKNLNDFKIIDTTAEFLCYFPNNSFEKRSKIFTLRYATKKMFPNLVNVFRIIENPSENMTKDHIAHLSVRKEFDKWKVSFCNAYENSEINSIFPVFLKEFFELN